MRHVENRCFMLRIPTHSEGFAGLPKPEGASNTKSYVDHAAKASQPEPVSFNTANMFTSNVSFYFFEATFFFFDFWQGLRALQFFKSSSIL